LSPKGPPGAKVGPRGLACVDLLQHTYAAAAGQPPA
jgi:hypothetical protein